jgi:hypothetical protein
VQMRRFLTAAIKHLMLRPGTKADVGRGHSRGNRLVAKAIWLAALVYIDALCK